MGESFAKNILNTLLASQKWILYFTWEPYKTAVALDVANKNCAWWKKISPLMIFRRFLFVFIDLHQSYQSGHPYSGGGWTQIPTKNYFELRSVLQTNFGQSDVCLLSYWLCRMPVCARYDTHISAGNLGWIHQVTLAFLAHSSICLLSGLWTIGVQMTITEKTNFA